MLKSKTSRSIRSAQAQRTTTQWTAQFLVASELARRGYTVAFTMGNQTPVADLMVGAPSGNQFWVDVKGLSKRNAWNLRQKPSRSNLYYILVCLAAGVDQSRVRSPDRFFILSQDEANALVNQYQRAHPNDRGRAPGFSFDDPKQYEGAWGPLPS